MFKGVDLKAKIGVSKNEMLYIQLPNRKLAEVKMYLFEFKQAGFERQTNPIATLTGKMLDCLGIQVEVTQNRMIKISKSGYIEKSPDLVHCYDNNLEHDRPLTSDDKHLQRPYDVQFALIEFYQSMVDVLNYLAECICLDFTYTLSGCAQKRKKLVEKDARQFAQFFCYISGTKEFDLTFTRGSVIPWGQARSIHSGCNIANGYMSNRFTFGEHYEAFFCDPLKIKRSALSSIVAEYVALRKAARVLIWLKSIGFVQNNSTVMFRDNKLCSVMVHERSNHKASHLINPEFHFTWNQVCNGKLVIHHKDTEVFVVDMLTKLSGMSPMAG